MIDAAQLHKDAVIIDGVCSLLDQPRYIEKYREGGTTVVTPTIGVISGAREAAIEIGRWHNLVAKSPDLLLIRSVSDILYAKAENKVGVLLHFQGADPLEDSLDLVDTYKSLGVGIIQLAFSARTCVGQGVEERGNSGLSRFGLHLIDQMNEARIVVDCAHTGYACTLDAIEASRGPVIISHGNARSVHGHPRNIPDDIIRAIAATGGTTGTTAYPPFVASNRPPTLDQFIDHVVHIASIAGPEHVSLAMDYFIGQHPYASNELATKFWEKMMSEGPFTTDTHPPPPHIYPSGIETPDRLPALTERMLARGLSEDEILAFYGKNLMRVLKRVWGG
ncbi:membrane dipeptidase [Sinorhizobium meliloti]|uniref:membrane dipeptidase n=2 Tax=Rhizobium meliloti TaxID=382 RepID=UPI000FDBF1BF|nr:membrane dipeptidase [Sinorhizobium meliloti]RVL00695.1 peptidase M19 [Sinorhizobium meliloti]RVN46430.1 peptidase M19 [Sinorhizobium meliloti]